MQGLSPSHREDWFAGVCTRGEDGDKPPISDIQVISATLRGGQSIYANFGDWDSTNNFLRAPLATGHGLTAIWAGSFPHGYFHHMALGKTIGYSTRLTQNNEELYTNDRHRHTRGIHIALMGDPTLRMHPVGPPGDLTGTVTEEGVRLDWQASLDEGIQGYHVYRARVREGNFTRLTRARIDGTQFTDSDVSSGNYTYMVRAVKLEQTPTIASPFFAKPDGTSESPSGARNWRRVCLRRPAFVLRPRRCATTQLTTATTNDLTPCRVPPMLSPPALPRRLRQHIRPYGYAGVVVLASLPVLLRGSYFNPSQGVFQRLHIAPDEERP